MNIQFTDFEKLRESIRKYGISDFEKQRTQIEKFEEEGLDINDLSDIFSTNNRELFVILQDGSIRKTIIHIVDISSWENENWGYPKFHIYFCQTIEKMQNEGKKNRYKASSRKDGQFYLIKNEKGSYKPLEICFHCLKQYNNQFKESKTKQNFPLREWIKNPMSDSEFSKMELDICTVPNRYTNSWPKISKTIKERASYICQTCKKDFSSKGCKKFLHVHHRDSDKRNNTKENLIPLCIECHSKEYNHGHIKKSPAYGEWLESKCFKVQHDK